METENSTPMAPASEAQEARAVSESTKKPGREPTVTVALVKRVSKRVGRGIPIRLALAGEPVTHDAYRKHLQRHPELAAIQEGAKIKFLDKTFDMILSRPGPMLRWLLERRHPDLFAKPREEAPAPNVAPTTQTQTQTIAGIPQEAVEEARKNAPKAQ